MASSASATYIDYDGEKSTMNFNVAEITADNIATVATAFGTLLTSIDAITLGNRGNRQLVIQSPGSNVLPTDPQASRENKWLVTYEDTTELLATGVPNPGYRKMFSKEIPTADRSLLAGNTDVLFPQGVLAAGVADFITAFEAFERSPYGGQPEVLKIIAVGRNL